MAGPWEAYQQEPAQPAAAPPAKDGPWSAYAGRSVVNQLTGNDGGERYQLWPERVARGVVNSVVSGFTFPGDVMAGKDSPENIGRVLDLATLGMPVNPAIRAGDKAIPGVSRAVRELPTQAPTTTELAESGGAAIQQGRNSDLVINPEAVSDFSKRVQQYVKVHRVEAPATFAKLADLENPAPGAIFTPNDLQAFRESLGKTAQNYNPNFSQDQLAASRAIKEFDTFLRGLGPKDVMVRPAASEAGVPATKAELVAQAMAAKREAERVADLFERGRGDYAAAMRSNDITGDLDRARTGLLERAEGRSSAANSGLNLDNTLRQKTEAILEKPKEISGYNDAELAALERVVEGGAGRNLARNISNKLGGGGGSAHTLFAGAGAGVGAAVAGWPGAVVGAAIPATVGTGARMVANALAKRDLLAVDELLRTRSPLYRERAANPELAVVDPDKRAAIARIMMMQAMGRRD